MHVAAWGGVFALGVYKTKQAKRGCNGRLAVGFGLPAVASWPMSTPGFTLNEWRLDRRLSGLLSLSRWLPLPGLLLGLLPKLEGPPMPSPSTFSFAAAAAAAKNTHTHRERPGRYRMKTTEMALFVRRGETEIMLQARFLSFPWGKKKRGSGGGGVY